VALFLFLEGISIGPVAKYKRLQEIPMENAHAASLNFRAVEDLRQWVEQQPHCTFVQAVFRAEGAMGSFEARERTKAALSWTYTCLTKRLCPRRTKLRRVPWWGGEPESGTAPHIHALLELPAGSTHDSLDYFANRYWRNRIKSAHARHVECDVLLRPLCKSSGEEQFYFSRYEGPTFSWGTVKVIYECMYLSPALTGISRPVFTH
jgi:hypothetical protein